MNRQQELFDIMSQHLVQQGEKSLGKGFDDGTCQYRGRGGLKCVVGALIKDEYYHADLEGKVIEHIDVRTAVSTSLGHALSEDDLSLLGIMQAIHDYHEPDEWYVMLSDFAADNVLEVNF